MQNFIPYNYPIKRLASFETGRPALKPAGRLRNRPEVANRALTHMHTCAYTHMHKHTHTHTHTNTHTQTHSHMQTYIPCAYMHTHAHANTKNTHACTCTWTLRWDVHLQALPGIALAVSSRLKDVVDCVLRYLAVAMSRDLHQHHGWVVLRAIANVAGC